MEMDEAAQSTVPEPAARAETGTEKQEPALTPADFSAVAGEYPAIAAAGPQGLPEDVRREVRAGRGLLDACRLHELHAAQAELAALRANKAAEAASTGSLQGGAGGGKDYYSPEEWDRLPMPVRKKFIRSGRIFDFMKKWGK